MMGTADLIRGRHTSEDIFLLSFFLSFFCDCVRFVRDEGSEVILLESVMYVSRGAVRYAMDARAAGHCRDPLPCRIPAISDILRRRPSVMITVKLLVPSLSLELLCIKQDDPDASSVTPFGGVVRMSL